MEELLDSIDEDKPPAGTGCVTCRAGGHFCPASAFFKEVALCAACKAGIDCPTYEAIRKRVDGVAVEPPEEVVRWEARSIPPDQWKESERVIQGTPERSEFSHDATVRPDPLKKKQKEDEEQRMPALHSITAEMRRQIHEEPTGTKAIAIAVKYNVSVDEVRRIRNPEAQLPVKVEKVKPTLPEPTAPAPAPAPLRRGGRVPPEVRRTICDAPADMSVAKIAKMTGISEPTVKKIRDEFKARQAKPVDLTGVIADDDATEEELSQPIYAPTRDERDLTEKEVEEIRAAETGTTARQLAIKYSVSIRTISDIWMAKVQQDKEAAAVLDETKKSDRETKEATGETKEAVSDTEMADPEPEAQITNITITAVTVADHYDRVIADIDAQIAKLQEARTGIVTLRNIRAQFGDLL